MATQGPQTFSVAAKQYAKIETFLAWNRQFSNRKDKVLVSQM